jgi:hypothetical protein
MFNRGITFNRVSGGRRTQKKQKKQKNYKIIIKTRKNRK